MCPEEYKRRLAAILSADVKGYSRLMRDNEEATVRTITIYRTAIMHRIEQYRGRLVDSPGDNLLAEFTSVVDAVNCGVEIQRELAERNAELPENRKMLFRIGINLGDVLEEGNRIYGDGVNISARMEALAEAGEICLSGTVYDAIENKIGLEYEYLGEHEVKNIDKPVRAYKILSYPGAADHRVIKVKRAVSRSWRNALGAVVALIVIGAALAAWHLFFRAPPIKVASIEKMAFPLPDKPSIAVLPFTSMSGDPQQEYFSDGITEEIITGLSKVPRLFVIARNSTFTYKDKPVKVQRVAEELGVRYVLEGSVRKAENRVRITAQLVDALTGKHLWAEKYDRALKDIFALQDEIMMKVTAALQVKLTEGEQALIVAGGTDNFEAYAKFLQGIEYLKRCNREGTILARKMAEEAIALDPNYPRGYRLLASTHWMDGLLHISKSPRNSLAKAAELYQKVIRMDPQDAVARGFLGHAYTWMRQHEKGIAEVEKAVTLNPNAADAQCFFGMILHSNGRHKEAIKEVKKAIRLNPFPPNWYFVNLGFAYRHAGMYEEAIKELKKALRIRPDNLFAHFGLASCYALLNLQDKARAEVEEILRLNPNFSLSSLNKVNPYKHQKDTNLVIDSLRKAGLPETPPLPLPDKPSIAVLPFTNMSGDPDQEYFSDGIAEEIITALSKVPKLFVIARNSTFTYKGKSVLIPAVGRELGVRYVLEGSVRKQEEKVRVTAQLIDAKTNHHIWAQRYDRKFKHIFAVQDEITKKVVTALQVKLTEGEQERMWAKGTDDLQAYIKVLQGRKHFQRVNKEGNSITKQLAKEAIALDPKYPAAYTLLGMAHHMDILLGSTKTPKKSMALAIELAQKAIALDEFFATAHGHLGWLYTMKREHEMGIAETERAIALNPNSADAYHWLGLALNYSGRHKEAITAYKKAIRLNPIPPARYLFCLAIAYRDSGHYEKAIEACKKALHHEPDCLLAHTCLASSYALLGREEKARAEALEVLRIDPKFSLGILKKRIPYKNQEDTKLVINSLRKAGLN